MSKVVRGVIGIGLSVASFSAYRVIPDMFERPSDYTQANMALGGVTHAAGETTTTVTPPTTIESYPDSDFYPGTAHLDLLRNQAAIHYIVIPTTRDPRRKHDMIEADDKAERQVLAHDPAIFDPVLTFTDTATEGLYRPSGYDVVDAEPMTLSRDCIDSNDDDQLKHVEDHARGLFEPNKLNIILLDAPACAEDFAGEAGPMIMPLINRGGFRNLPNDVDHEGAHYFGVAHSGLDSCDDPVTIANCTVDLTGDRNSMMGYEFPDKYSTPDLVRLGLIGEDQIIRNPGEGTYLLRDQLLPDDPKATQELVLHTDDGEIDLSWERDVDLPQVAGQDHSLQVRKRVQDGTWSTTTLIGRNPIGLIRPKNNEGAAMTGDLLYRDSHQVIYLLGQTADREAIVSITAK